MLPVPVLTQRNNTERRTLRSTEDPERCPVAPGLQAKSCADGEAIVCDVVRDATEGSDTTGNADPQAPAAVLGDCMRLPDMLR